MTDPQFHGRWRSFSVSKALDTLGDTLSTIRREDNLTWKEVGRIIGKSEDRASNYASGLGEMPVSAFLLACREWNGRFANATLSMIGMSLVPDQDDATTDTAKLAHVLKLTHLMSAAIADDATPGVIDDRELDGISDVDLDEAEAAITALRARKARRSAKLVAVA
jgi:transcriptional regulator with XRE-family HTH domain